MSATQPVVLFLGARDSRLYEWLVETEKSVIQAEQRIDAGFIRKNNVSFIISYNYTHIIKKDVLSLLPDRVVNLHIGYLPWNRGADPNFWSFVDDTPRGVTIHYVDTGIDTGDIIAQRGASFGKDETLRTSYNTLQVAVCDLFKEHWSAIRAGTCPRSKQMGQGSFHKASDKDALFKLLSQGWDTRVLDVKKLMGNG